MYKVIKQFASRGWEIGDIVSADQFSATKLIQDGFLEEYTGSEPPKHRVINVDPVKLSAKQF